MKIFRGLGVFEYAVWQKTKTRKYRKSKESFLNKKASTVKVNITRKLLNSYQFVIKYRLSFNKKKMQLSSFNISTFPANISTSDQRCFNVADQH